MSRGRKQTVSRGLPRFMMRRIRNGKELYYYAKNNIHIALGGDLQVAMAKYSEIIARNLLTPHPWHRHLFLAEILDRAIKPTDLCGVYFLIKGTSVVYVGQSKNILRRVAQHPDKNFDRFAWVLCDSNDLDRLEAEYIAMLGPKLNTLRPKAVLQKTRLLTTFSDRYGPPDGNDTK